MCFKHLQMKVRRSAVRMAGTSPAEPNVQTFLQRPGHTCCICIAVRALRVWALTQPPHFSGSLGTHTLSLGFERAKLLRSSPLFFGGYP